MSLDEGIKLKGKPLTMLHDKNLKRLLIWMTVGADALNGLWAIYGARLGCFMTNSKGWAADTGGWDYTLVRDFKWHAQHWKRDIWPKIKDNRKLLVSKIFDLGHIIRKDLNLPITEMSPENSKFFKQVYVSPTRTAPLIREDQIYYD